MRFTAAALFLAGSALAAPSGELAKKNYGYAVAVETVTKVVAGYPAAVQPPAHHVKTVYQTVTVGAQPANKHHHHHHYRPHHKSSKTSCTETPTKAAAHGGYTVITYVVGGGQPTHAPKPPTYQPQPPKAPQPPTYQPQPKPQPPQTGGDSPSDDMKAVLDLHNNLRAKHGAPPLTWSQDIVNSCNSQLQCVFQHMHGTGNGENIAQGYGSATDAVQAWYDEVKDYSYGSGFSESTGHFTQLVWVKSTHLGCVLQPCGGSPLLRCQYHTPGNFQGEFAQNVLPGGYGKKN